MGRRLPRILLNAAMMLSPLLGAVALVGCCPREITAPQVVDPTPLETARVPADIASILPLFPDRAETIVAAGRHKDGTANPDGIIEWISSSRLEDALVLPGVHVDVYLYRTEAAATKSFEFGWRHMWWKPDLSRFTRRGRSGDQCVISYMHRTRVGADVPFSCAHTADYDSFVMFQKGRVIVQVRETSTDTRGERKERVIARIARTLEQAGGRLPAAAAEPPA